MRAECVARKGPTASTHAPRSNPSGRSRARPSANLPRARGRLALGRDLDRPEGLLLGACVEAVGPLRATHSALILRRARSARLEGRVRTVVREAALCAAPQYEGL